ncbi:MAG: cache domain-containing protein, partial [Candidatus Nitrosomaritimum yanchengensis]
MIKISYVIIAVMFAISLTFTIVGIITFDLTSQEIKKLLGSRNEGFAFNMMQGLDKHIEKRILDFQDLTNLNLIHYALIQSNEEFEKIENIEEYLLEKEKDIEFDITAPFIGTREGEVVSEEFEDIINFYHDEYNYDVIEELFITNAYGANVVFGSGTSDYFQSDEEWWQKTKENGIHKGKIQFNEYYQSYSIDFAFRVNDVDGNFIGVLRVVVTLDDLLSDFREESNLLTTSGRNAVLLDENGYSFFSNDMIGLSDSPTSYSSLIFQGPETGYFELEDDYDDFQLVSYAQSSGYKSFEGFDWVAVVEQNSSSIVGEFIDLRNAILTASISGMIASVVGGLLISSTIST